MGGDQRDVRTGWPLGIAHHVECGKPQQGACGVVLHVGQQVGESRQRGRIEPHFGIAEVAVVEQEQVRTGCPLQCGDRGDRLRFDVDVDSFAAYDLLPGPVVQADADPVRSEDGMVGWCGLGYDDRAILVGRVDVGFRPQRVDLRFAEPDPRPLGEVAPARGAK